MDPHFEDTGQSGAESGEEDPHWKALGHVRRVNGREGEAMVAQLAYLLLRILEPLQQTLLVDKLDRSCTNTRVEQGTLRSTLTTAHTAQIPRRTRLVLHSHASQNHFQQHFQLLERPITN
uniref:Uncharacterized protein n=1 Tax=Lepeophtheirus salmonis TaxID=72036 RepID=A0A0K2V9F6_LEPSM